MLTNALLVLVVVAIEPLAISLTAPHGQHIYLFDIALVALIGWAVVHWRDVNRAAALLVALTAVALAAHPSIAGALLVGRLAGAVALVSVLTSMPRSSFRFTVAALLVGACGETVLTIAQRAHGGPIGLSRLGELPTKFMGLYPNVVMRGTFIHPYPLAAFGIVVAAMGAYMGMRARRPWYWFAAAGVAMVPAGLTYSRMAFAGALVVVVALVVAGRTHARAWIAAAALTGAFLAGALVSQQSWRTRVDTTIAAHSVEDLTSGRLALVDDGLDAIREHPVVGVGPARYATQHAEEVHNIPVLIGSEVGVLGGLVALAILVALGVRAWRGGALSAGLYGAYMPFVLLDRFPWGTAQGLVLSGLWAGAVLRQSTKETAESDPQDERAEHEHGAADAATTHDGRAVVDPPRVP